MDKFTNNMVVCSLQAEESARKGEEDERGNAEQQQLKDEDTACK